MKLNNNNLSIVLFVYTYTFIVEETRLISCMCSLVETILQIMYLDQSRTPLQHK